MENNSKRSKRLQLVVDLAIAAETQAARNLSEAQRELKFERQRLSDIQSYYSSYEDRFSKNTKDIRGRDIANSRVFLSNLEQACQAQAYQLSKSERKVELARNQWRKSHLKTDALEAFQENLANSEQAIEDRKEQNLIDDLVNQRGVFTRR